MKSLKNITLALLLSLFTVCSFASTWAPIYAYTQKTEKGKVKSISFPYGVYDGGFGPGETFVYTNGKLIYTIDKYFSNPFFTIDNGKYLIECDFLLDFIPSFDGNADGENGSSELTKFNGKAIYIYKEGKLINSIDLNELNIDSSKIKVNEIGNWFTWNYSVNEAKEDALQQKMSKHSAFIENDSFFLITADNQLIEIDVTTGKVTRQENAYEILKQRSHWSPKSLKRKFKKVNYPNKFLLPLLQNGKSIDESIAVLLNKNVASGDSDSAVIQIYFHTLLINKEGKCEKVYLSISIKSDSKNANLDKLKLKIEIEEWLKQQTFKTSTFPKGFPKYKNSNFVYFK